MKINEVIMILQAIREDEGNVEVNIHDENEGVYRPAHEITVEKGYRPNQDNSKIVIITGI